MNERTCRDCHMGHTLANHDRGPIPIYAALVKDGPFLRCVNCGRAYPEYADTDAMNMQDLRRHVVEAICASSLNDPRNGQQFTDDEQKRNAEEWVKIETAFAALRKRVSPLSLGLMDQLNLIYSATPQGDGTEVPVIRDALQRMKDLHKPDQRPSKCKQRMIDEGATTWPRFCSVCNHETHCTHEKQ